MDKKPLPITFMGFPVQPHPLVPHDVPNFQLAPGDYIGEEFRERMQAWCNEFFGTHDHILIMGQGTGRKILVTDRIYRRLCLLPLSSAGALLASVIDKRKLLG